MLKSLLLSSTRPFYAPEKGAGAEDTRSEAQKQRDSIKVDSIKKNEPEKEEVKDDVVEENDEDIEVEDNTEEEDTDEEEGEKSEEEKKVEAKEVAKLNKIIERLQKRVGKTTSEKNEIARQLADAQAALAAKVEPEKVIQKKK